jgi:PAS domain S-box-containing protein
MAAEPSNQPTSGGWSNASASSAPARREHAAEEIAWLAALVDSTDDAIIAKDIDGTIVAWNAAAGRLYGYTPTEAVGCPIAVLVPPEARDEYEQIMEQVGRGERIRELETVRLRKDGSRVQVSLTISPVRGSTGDVVGSSVVARDLSERKRRETEILKGRARLRAILDTAVDAIITIDDRGLIQTINPATERLFGYTAAELIEQNVNILMPPPYREEHDGYLSRYKETGEKRIIGIGREVQARRKDGTVFPIDLAASEVEPGVLFTGIIRDLSERKIMEANLRQADRMAMIGTVAAGLGHDINNLLLLLRMDTDALSICSLSADGVAAVESLRSVTDYLRDLVRGLRMVALDPESRGDGTSRTTCLADWCPATVALLKTVSCPGVAVELRVPPGLPDVRIAPHQLTQVVFNLVGNAVHAIVDAPRGGGGGVVRVSAGPKPGENGVRLQVADNGSGMSPEVLTRAFEPLFTTRAERGGTGLGLALVKRLVTDAGGEVSIESKPGTGTTVTVDLCAAPAVSETAADGPTAVVSLADARAAALVRRVLESLGTPVRSDNDPDHGRFWIVDPAVADVNKVKHWLAGRPQRRLVLFGRPQPGPAPAWEAIPCLTIEDPDDFEGLRATIAHAVSAW